MADWRLARRWSDEELQRGLEDLQALPRNFSEAPEQMTEARGWRRHHSEEVVAHAPPGVPIAGGPFARARTAVQQYAFSDPRIVVGHFAPDAPLLGRRMLLELRVLRVLHYLEGVVVGATRSERADEQSVFGYRYDTLEGHIERGVEGFLLTKEHATGEIRFRIEAAWKPGQFPNWWSRAGFAVLGRHYQRTWRRHAHARLARLIGTPDYPRVT